MTPGDPGGDRGGDRERHAEDSHPDPDASRPVYHPPTGRPVSGRLLGYAAAFAGLLTLVSFWFTADWYSDRATDPLLTAVAAEAVRLHGETAIVETDDLTALLGALDARGPVRVAALAPAGASLVDGRRVELMSQPAVALRYGMEGTVGGTVFVVRPSPSQMARVPARATVRHPASLRVDDHDVVIWRDGDYLVVRVA